MKRISTLLAYSSVVVLASAAYATHNSPESLEARVSAVGHMNVSDTASASASENAGPADGGAVYAASCAACHDGGVGGAPVSGEAADWEDRLEQGLDTLVTHAIQGFQGSAGVMPAKGGNPALSDEEVTAAVEHMVSLVSDMPLSSDSADEEPADDAGDTTANASASGEAAEDAATTEQVADETETTEADTEVSEDTSAEATEEQVAAAPSADGEAVYAKACFACHTPGVAGAPKIGDAAGWTDRIAQGIDTLNDHAINGYQGSAGVMPAKGGNPSLSDDEVKAAVQYMVDQSQ